ncbi:MAG TPA: outer membrane protein assembly factor BamD [Blastocatellia bacterium]|nr:outer membrane protein assembly factor BamD [Blastocatellia bacterium]
MIGGQLNRSHRAWLLAAVAVLALAAGALGCALYDGSDHSVRFNAFRTAKEFGRLPRLSHSGDADNQLFSWVDEDEDEDYEVWRHKGARIDDLWNEALRDEQHYGLAAVRNKLQEYLQRTSRLREPGYYGPKDIRQRRNAAFDKLDALVALDQGAREPCVRAYLRARTSYDEDHFDRKLLDVAASDVHLQDNAAYLRAAVTYRAEPEKSVAEFAALAARYPKSEKREAALYMAALATFKPVQSAPTSSDATTSTADCDDDCRNRLRDAQAKFRRVITEYPQGRLTADAQGWIAYIYRQLGDRAAALAEYYRMLGARDEASRIEAVFSLGIARYHASEADMARVEKLVENEPAAALAYAYHNVYNFALEPLSGYRWRGRYDNKADELKRIVAFATRMMKRYGGGVGSGFVVRLAQASLELDNDTEAARLARQALNAGAQANIRAEALWVEGFALYRLKRLKEARATLTQLVAENPNNRYTEGARRNLAMVAEDMNDLDGALEQYLALDYRLDVNYFVDVLMPTDQLAAFIKHHPAQPHGDELQYALGVRYLRDRRWNDARQTLMAIHPVGRGADESFRIREERYVYQHQLPAKALNIDKRVRGVRVEWIEQDLHTASDFERLERQVSLATDDEVKAEALYQLASYQFQGNLLFYNPAWNGMRHYYLYDLDSGGYRRADESRLLFEYMQKHDAASSALPFYLEVADRYPNTRAARDALYTAAVCHDRLANYNNYWRAIYERGGFAGARMVDYKDVRRAYPDYRYPLGTIGWEPATRTVNGGPGWELPPKPKPKPRPSRTRRVLARLNKLTQVALLPVANIVNGLLKMCTAILLASWKVILWVGHWLWLGYLCFWLWFVWRRSRDARRLMREGLARCRERPADEKGDTSLVDSITPQLAVLNQYLGHDWRDRFLKLSYDWLYKLRQMAREPNARRVLLLVAATHWVLVVIAFKLLADW